MSGRRVATLGGLAAALAVYSGSAFGQAKPAVDPGAPAPRATENSKAAPAAASERCGKANTRIEGTGCAEIRTAAATEAQAEAARDQVRLGWWQVVGLLASFFISAVAAIAAAVAARAATKATTSIPILERAYPYVVIKSHNTEKPLDDGAQSSAQMSKMARASVEFVVKNYGKTPATILGIAAEVLITGTGRVMDVKPDFFPKEVMLGEGDETETFTATMSIDIYASDFFGIHNGTQNLLFTGWVIYRDVWQEEHTVPFAWRYNQLYKQWMTKPR